MKIENFSNLSLEELTETLEKEGIAKGRLSEAMESSFLPASGTFSAEPELSGKDKYKHIRINTTTGEGISLSRLQIRGFNSENEVDIENDILETGENAKNPNTFYLRSNITVNPHLQGNQAALIQKLVGKKFTAKPVKVRTTLYNEDGYQSREEVVTKIVDAYEIVVR